ncbi:DedA protein [Klebsiella pneumoniae]|nr:DedA protein [Klebsiella pneumoniae]
MDLIHFLIDFILHIDVHLAELVAQYGVWVYAILFLILFCETGLVVTPFLPGDSLLFVAGALSALPTNDLNVHLMVLLMVIAAIVGDAVNYTIGRLFGEKLFSNPNSKIFRRSYLDKNPQLLRTSRRENHYPGALCADSPNLCAVCGGNGAYVLSSFCGL